MASGDSEERSCFNDTWHSMEQCQQVFKGFMSNLKLEPHKHDDPNNPRDDHHVKFFKSLVENEPSDRLGSIHNPSLILLNMGTDSTSVLMEVAEEHRFHIMYRVVTDDNGLPVRTSDGKLQMMLQLGLRPIFVTYAKGLYISEIQGKLSSAALEYLKEMTQCTKFVRPSRYAMTAMPEVENEDVYLWPSMEKTSAANFRKLFEAVNEGPMTDPRQFFMDANEFLGSSVTTDTDDEKVSLTDSDSDHLSVSKSSDASDDDGYGFHPEAIENQLSALRVNDGHVHNTEGQRIFSIDDSDDDSEGLNDPNSGRRIEEHCWHEGLSGPCSVSTWSEKNMHFVFSHKYLIKNNQFDEAPSTDTVEDVMEGEGSDDNIIKTGRFQEDVFTASDNAEEDHSSEIADNIIKTDDNNVNNDKTKDDKENIKESDEKDEDFIEKSESDVTKYYDNICLCIPKTGIFKHLVYCKMDGPSTSAGPSTSK